MCPTNNGLDTILQRGVIRVATLSMDWPPMITGINSDSPQGLDVEIARDIAKHLGVSLELIPCSVYWDEVIDAVANGQADIALSEITATLERAKRVAFTAPYIRFYDALIVDRLVGAQEGWMSNNGQLNLPNQGRGLLIGALKKTVYADEFIQREFPQADTLIMETYEECIQALKDRRIPLFYDGQVFTWQFLQSCPELALYYTIAPGADEDVIAIAVSPYAPRLLNWLNMYIENTLSELNPEAVLHWYSEGMVGDILHTHHRFNPPAAPQPDKSELIDDLLLWSHRHAYRVAAVGVLVLCVILLSRKSSTLMRWLGIESLCHGLISILRMRSTFVISVAGGILFGIYFPDSAAALLDKPSHLFLSALHMCGLPYVFAAVTCNVATLIQKGGAHTRIFMIVRSLVFTMCLGLICITVLSAIVPFDRMTGKEMSRNLGRIIVEQEDQNAMAGSKAINGTKQKPEDSIIPNNIIRAMFHENMLSVLFFAILFGFALGIVPSPSCSALLNGLKGLEIGIMRILKWVLVFLPLGLFSLLGHAIAIHDVDILLPMVGFVGAYNIISLLLCIGLIIFIAHRTGLMPWRLLLMLRQSLGVAFASANKFATMPITLEELSETTIDTESAAAILPLSFTFCSLSKMVLFALTVFFFGSLYQVHLGMHELSLLTIGLLTLFLQTAGLGTTLAIPFLATLLIPLGIPGGSSVYLLFLTLPFVKPIGTVLNVLTGVAISSQVSSRHSC